MVLSLFTYFQLFTALWPREKDTLTMFFIGDIMQHEAQLKAAYVGEGDINEPNCYNYSSYFKHIEPLYSKADIVAANIETNFAPPPYSGYPTFCSPSSLVKQIVESGFNLLFTANNHILDRGRVGVESTIELYQQLGVDYIGVYRNSAEAATNHPLIVEKGEFRVAFLNYTYGTNGVPIPKPFVVNTLDSVRIKRELKELRKLKELRDPIERVDLIIASFHWGEEYVTTPSKEQLIWEKFLYRNGVDIIIGHHPHVPQPVKVYHSEEGRISNITAYSLGNAISNMTVRNSRVGVALKLRATKERFSGKIDILEPIIEYIWTTRPKEGDSNYSIVPIKEALESPNLYPVAGELDLIRHYYKIFNR